MAQMLLRLIKWVFTFTYFPVVLFNPVFVLHFINTYASYADHSDPVLSPSPHPAIEIFGPITGSPPYLDMHGDSSLCLGYTAVMFVLQYIAFEQIHVNRERAKTQKLSKRKSLKGRLEKTGSSEEVVDVTSEGKS